MPSPPRPKKGIDKATLVIYCIIGAVILIGCILLGGAMDLSLDKTGHIDITRLGKGFNYILSHPAYIFRHLADTNSYIPKMLFFGAMAIGIFALYKYSEDKKRLHRRGTEHGSAKWCSEKEMRSLADPAPRKLHPIKVFDRYEFQIEWSKPESWMFRDGTFTLLNEKGVQTLSFSIVHSDRVDTSVNSEPEKQKSAEELQQEIKIGTEIALKDHPKKECVGEHCIVESVSMDENGTQKIDSISPDGHRVYDDKGKFMGVMIDNNILLTKNVFLSLNAKQHLLNFNVLIIGGSGSGKTRFFAKPNIMQLNTSYVITDPKGEILMSCGEMLRAAGYKVRVFNLIQMEHSNNYNPFHYVYDEHGQVSEDNVNKMVNILFSALKKDGEKEDFWSKKGQSMLQAVIFKRFAESEYHALRDKNGLIIPETRDESKLNFYAVAEDLRKLQYPPRGSQVPDGYFLTRNPDESKEAFEARRAKAFLCPLDKEFLELEKRDPNSLAVRMYKEVRNAPEETGQSFLSSANVNTFLFNLRNLQNLTCCDNIHLETLGDEKTALFIIISATDTTYNFMAAMMYTQLFDTLANRANFVHKGVLPVHVRCIMDEFANISQIPDFDKVIAFVRSMGMSLNVIIQNIAQLKARYEKTWEVITGNCDTTIFLGGKEESTLKSISEQLGKETIDIRGTNRTKGRQSSTSENNSIAGRELMQPNELATMPISDCIVLIRSHDPMYDQKYPIEQHPNYRFLGDSGSVLPPFDVSRVHAVTYEQFMAEQKVKHEKVDTNVNSGKTADANTKSKNEPETEPESKTVSAAFKQPDSIQVSADTILASSYEEAAEEMRYEEPALIPDEVQYKQSDPKFSIPKPLTSEDFGEPIIGKEGDDSDEETEISPEPVTETANMRHYDVPDAEPMVEPELSPEDVAAAVPVVSEHSAKYPREQELFTEADLMMFDEMDEYMSPD